LAIVYWHVKCDLIKVDFDLLQSTAPTGDEKSMIRTNHHTLIDRGRKAGLGTSELYRALAARQIKEADEVIGQGDGNGFVVGYDQHGQPIYQPGNGSSRW
jgi:hypothetical protein